jgi:adenylate cyclase
MEPGGETTDPGQPSRETAVIFAELIGAAELYAKAGDAAGQEALQRCADMLRKAAEGCGARVIKRIGGRLMAAAPTADDAARAAVAMQAAALDFPETEEVKLGLGVGFHFGTIIQNESDVFGDTVNTAARLVEQAARGQVLLSADTAEKVGSLFRRSVRRLYSVQLKGLKEELALCEIVWRADEPATFYPMQAEDEPVRAKLKLRYKGNKMVLRRILEALTIGRDSRCGLVVDDEHASRHHCTIQRRHDHFVLADKSTNGTFVTVEGEDEIALHRDEITLRKRGWISFGQPKAAGGETVEFNCDD